MVAYAEARCVRTFVPALQAVLADVHVTTSYSGMGCAEATLPLRDALAAVGVQAKLTVVSASDSEKKKTAATC